MVLIVDDGSSFLFCTSRYKYPDTEFVYFWHPNHLFNTPAVHSAQSECLGEVKCTECSCVSL